MYIALIQAALSFVLSYIIHHIMLSRQGRRDIGRERRERREKKVRGRERWGDREREEGGERESGKERERERDRESRERKGDR